VEGNEGGAKVERKVSDSITENGVLVIVH